jgi:hypothetical protein
MAYKITYDRIPEEVVEGKRLGRHLRHDSRSLQYLVPRVDPETLSSKKWRRTVPSFDQGDLGSCTGNAAVGLLATEPFASTLVDQVAAGKVKYDENEAVSVYSAATALDNYPGQYPPQDTGSDGLAVAQVLRSRGFVSGFNHAIDLNTMASALQSGPVMVGVNWYEGFDNPASDGRVKISGRVRGGHEFEVNEIDIENRVFWAVQSWGPSWGKDGTFYFSFDDMIRLFNEQGDCTSLVPLDQPAPTPTPPPQESDDQKLWDVASEWVTHRRYAENNTLKKSLIAWGQAKGF